MRQLGAEIRAAIQRDFDVDVKSHCRNRIYVHCRAAAFAALHDCKWDYARIAHTFGFGHTTVLHAIKRVRAGDYDNSIDYQVARELAGKTAARWYARVAAGETVSI